MVKSNSQKHLKQNCQRCQIPQKKKGKKERKRNRKSEDRKAKSKRPQRAPGLWSSSTVRTNQPCPPHISVKASHSREQQKNSREMEKQAQRKEAAGWMRASPKWNRLQGALSACRMPGCALGQPVCHGLSDPAPQPEILNIPNTSKLNLPANKRRSCHEDTI